MTARVLIMAGGTGGHVYPALAVAEHLRGLGAEVSWLGTRRGLEARVVPASGIDIAYVSVSGLRRKGLLSWALAPFKLLFALVQSCWVLLRRRPAAVLGMGGFVTGPGGVASWILRRPLLIHEQNAVAGLTNRLLARFATRVMEAFPGAFPAGTPAVLTGNPVRADIAALPSPESRFAGRMGALRVLVLGGSQGAAALNEVMPRALQGLPAEQRPEVWHQAGPRQIDVARAGYEDAGIDARVEPFIEDMAGAYGWADLVICRAGALTIAELTAAGVGSVLVPYPYAVDDHQTRNARWVADADAARLVPQHELTPAVLANLLRAFASDRAQLLRMANAARGLARTEAGEMVARMCLEAMR